MKRERMRQVLKDQNYWTNKRDFSVKTNEIWQNCTVASAGSNSSVYYSLKFFYVAIESTIVSGILQQATRLAGLSSDKFTAISFRSIGATTAIGNNIGPLLYKN